MPSTFLIFYSMKIFPHHPCCSVINSKRFISSACRLCIFRQRNTPCSILYKVFFVDNSIVLGLKISIFLRRIIRIYHINRDVIRCGAQCSQYRFFKSFGQVFRRHFRHISRYGSRVRCQRHIFNFSCENRPLGDIGLKETLLGILIYHLLRFILS